MTRDCSFDIAVTGISARLPGLSNLNQWWLALLEGKILTTKYDSETLLEAGVSETLLRDPSYIPVRGHLDNADRFDNKLFRVSPRDVEMMDPQHRLMLEAAWSGLEDAGYGNSTNRPVTGVFASSSGSGYLRSMLSQGPLDYDTLEQALHGTEPDFIASLIAYKLNLSGPAIAIQTACSSSLVSVHFAVQSLLNGDCDQAIVVAAGIAFPQSGHLYAPGGIKSETGICRPFDYRADGVVEGSGVACVVLQRLDDALKDCLDIYGIILGTAVNNDGAAKAGYYAPSVSGQAAVIQAALSAANVDATSIGYLESHGTGTQIGDPIEWSSTSEAYKIMGAERGQIALGALKANIGHTDAAAGLASLIKSLLVVKEGIIPPVAGFNTLNPLLESNNTPLFVPTQKKFWDNRQPRRAAISAFGIGGTNAHVIIEEPPKMVDTEPSKCENFQIVVLSAADSETLLRTEKQIKEHLIEIENGTDIADIAFTLLEGREMLSERLAICARRSEEVVQALESGLGIIRGRATTDQTKPIIFLFTGQGSQYPGMALPYINLPSFKENLTECLDAFEPIMREKVHHALLNPDFNSEILNETELAQPALFALEYTIAKTLMKVGVNPSAVVGHSLGEISAACLAGAFCLQDAAKLVITRGKAMQDCPRGAMLAVNKDPTTVKRLIEKTELPLYISAINTPESCVVSGGIDAVDKFQQLINSEVLTRLLRTNRAFHSPLIEPALEEMSTVLNNMTSRIISLPIAVNTSGKILNVGEVFEVSSLLNQARTTVLFSGGLEAISQRFNDALYVEIGPPGRTLTSIAASMNLHSLPLVPTRTNIPGPEIYTTLGKLWTLGYPIDLKTICGKRKRIHLPTYPFFGPKWLAPEAAAGLGNRKEPKILLEPPVQISINEATIAKEKSFQNIYDKLVDIWIELFSYEAFNNDSDFFETGGDSLLMVSLIRKVKHIFNIQVSPRQMLTARTLGAQAKIIYDHFLQLDGGVRHTSDGVIHSPDFSLGSS